MRISYYVHTPWERLEGNVIYSGSDQTRTYDRGMLDDRNKVTTSEAARRALKDGYTITPLHNAGGKSVTPTKLHEVVRDANDKKTMHTHGERLSAIMSGIGR